MVGCGSAALPTPVTVRTTIYRENKSGGLLFDGQIVKVVYSRCLTFSDNGKESFVNTVAFSSAIKILEIELICVPYICFVIDKYSAVCG